MSSGVKHLDTLQGAKYVYHFIKFTLFVVSDYLNKMNSIVCHIFTHTVRIKFTLNGHLFLDAFVMGDISSHSS